MRTLKALLAVTMAFAALLLVACSPEDGRQRGQAGADVGNRPDASVDVDIHGKQNPNFDVPNRLPAAEQPGKR